MFNTNGILQAVIEAPDCIYDTAHNTANSAGHLQLRTGDGKIRVEGDGFLWRRDDSFLTISNQSAHGDGNRPGNEHWLMKTVCLIALMAVAAGVGGARPVEHERRAPIAARDRHLFRQRGFRLARAHGD